MDMRGLSVFISDIRKCPTKEAEEMRINKELAKARAKFKNSAKLSGYDRKKYICKLLYIYMLGYDIDFGHMEAVNLLSSTKYSEKHLGYLACTLLLHEGHELLTLITNSIKRDLNSRDVNYQCLALTAVANVGGKEFAEALTQDVQKLLVSGETRNIVRKKAALTLLRLYRKYPEILPPDAWSSRVIALLGGKDLGVITSVMSLVLGLVANSPEEYKESVQRAVKLLTKLVLNREYSSDYIYYGIPAPWLQVKLLRLLQFYPPPEDKSLMDHITEVLNRLISASERIKTMDRGKTVSRTNASHAVLFEALNLAIHYDNDPEILTSACNILGKYLQDRDTNLRYLALDTMSRLAYSQNKKVIQSIRKHQDTILFALKDPDISIRRRALDLLYSMCNKHNAGGIVGELLTYLPLSDFAIREELVLKVAILAEKYATEFSWYVDVILTLITQAGDFVSDDIWFRVIQIVTNRQDTELQKYAAETVLKAVSSPAAHETAIKVAGYILGEFGYLIAEKEGCTPDKQFSVLYSKFPTSSYSTKAILLNTFIKFYNLYEVPHLREKIKQIFEKHADHIEAELQQRSNEYSALTTVEDSIMQTVLDSMPPFEERESSVLLKILERQKAVAEGGIRQIKHQTEKQEVEKEKPKTEDPVINTQQVEEKPPVQLDTLLDLGMDMTPTTTDQVTEQKPMDLGDFLSGFDTQPTEIVQPQPQPTQEFDPFAMPFDQPVNNDMGSIAQQTASIASVKAKERIEQNVSIDALVSEQKHFEEVQFDEVQVAENFKQLLINKQGTIGEDQTIAVRIKTEYHGPKGRIALYFGNKTESVISQVRVEIEQLPELKFEYSTIAPMIMARSQVQQYISVSCLAPFDRDVKFTLFFEYNKKSYKFTLRLPVILTKFLEPAPVPNASAFFSKWNAIPKDSPQAPQSIIKPFAPINVLNVKSLLGDGFKMALVDGIEKNPNNCVGSATFHTLTGVYGVLVRVESGSTMYRVTVKSTDPIVAKVVHENICNQLGTIHQ